MPLSFVNLIVEIFWRDYSAVSFALEGFDKAHVFSSSAHVTQIVGSLSHFVLLQFLTAMCKDSAVQHVTEGHAREHQENNLLSLRHPPFLLLKKEEEEFGHQEENGIRSVSAVVRTGSRGMVT